MVQGLAERLPERDEPGHLFRARRRLAGLGRGGQCLRPYFMPLADLVNDEHEGEDDQAGHELKAPALIDLPRVLEHLRERP